MTQDEARAAIESLVSAGWSATPVAYPNVAFSPPAGGGAWARLAIEPRGAVQASFGGSGRRFRCAGEVRLELLVPSGTGTAGACQLADAATGLFAEAAVDGLTFAAASTVAGRNDDAWFSLLVIVPFWHDDIR